MQSSKLDSVVSQLASGDPILGNRALADLVQAGIAGEEAFLERSIDFPETAQESRRLLRYVASREDTLKDKLLERIKHPKSGDQPNAIAFLFAGITPDFRWKNSAYQILHSGFKGAIPTSETLRNPSRMRSYFLAWGNLGGSGSSLWHFIRSDSCSWEKLRGAAFRAACAYTARVDAEGLWAIEQLCTHDWEHNGFEAKRIPSNEIDYTSSSVIGAEELYEQVFTGSFSLWKRGELADAILKKWSKHKYLRIRKFGADILGNLQLKRTVPALIQWHDRETNHAVKLALLESIGRIATIEGVDFLLKEWHNGNKDVAGSLAQNAWRAGNQSMAKEALSKLEEYSHTVGCKALVSSAKCGRRSPLLEKFLQSTDPYDRLNAALAIGYLKDAGLLPLLDGLYPEASNTMEALFICAAMAIGEKPGAAEQLRVLMQKMAEEPGYNKRVDAFFLPKFLQDALIDGLKAGGEATELYCKAWQAEMEKFDPIPKKVLIDPPEPEPSTEKTLNAPTVDTEHSSVDSSEEMDLSANDTSTQTPAEEPEVEDFEKTLASEDGILATAIKLVPVFRYVVGSAAVCILATILIRTGFNLATVFLVGAVLLIAAVVLIVLSWIPKMASSSSRKLAGVLAWSLIATFILSILCLLTSTVFDRPWNLQSWINNQLQQETSPASETIP